MTDRCGEISNARMRLGPWFLVSTRLEEMGRFYRDIVGLTPAHWEPDHHIWFSLGGLELAIHAPESEAGPDFTPSERGIFMWFESLRPLAEIASQLRERGAQVWGPFDGGRRELLYTLDPDGNMVGLYRPRDTDSTAADVRANVPLPTLVVVSGPAGSGKTELARALAATIGCPVISRDEIKEGMVHTRGGGFAASTGDPLTQRTFPLFFEVLKLLLAQGVTVVAEAAFQDRVWREGLAGLLPLAQLRIVHCTVDAAVAEERVRRRMSDPRRSAHADAEWLADRPKQFERISLPAPSLLVDTTDGYVPDLPTIVGFIRR